MKNIDLTRLDGLTAPALLSIDEGEPERLFTGDGDALQKEYRHLARRWHPDLNGAAAAAQVFAHLAKLCAKAKEKLAAGTWQTPGLASFEGLDGRCRRLRYVKKAALDIGALYIARSVLVFEIDGGARDLFEAGCARLRRFSFADTAMKEAYASRLPAVRESFETKTACVLTIEKPPGFVRLRDLIEHQGGALDPKHAAWVLSGMYDIACYLQWAGLTHNAIGPDSWFVDPATHAGALLGGWWFATKKGEPLLAVPSRTSEAMPRDVWLEGLADPRVDLGLIRLAGREMLGDPAGLSIHKDPNVPSALSLWLRAPASQTAFEDYETWQTRVLTDSYGPRRFIDLPVSFDDIYAAKGGVHATTRPRTPTP